MNVFAWWNHLPYDHPGLWAILGHWPLTVFLPFVVSAVIVLATATRISDARDRHQAARNPAVISSAATLTV